MDSTIKRSNSKAKRRRWRCPTACGERFSCRGRILGAYYADAKAGCKAFHVCVRVAGGGVRDFRFFCPPGTLFHQEAQTCTDWGDDDPLACPADLYDGQFDLYKIGSGYDTRKLSSNGPREDEAELSLQRADGADRRAQPQPGPASDLRAAHSSDFFSGQRERGRDDSAPAPPAPSAPPAVPRQSFRRPPQRVTATAPPPTTAPPAPPAPPAFSEQPHYDPTPKRKFVRKRPVFVPSTTSTPSTFAPNYSPQQQQQQQQQTFFEQPTSQNFGRRPADDTFRPPQQSPQFQQPQRQQQPQQPQFSQPTTSTPQYNEEYVEVSRVTPKNNKYFSNTAPTSTPYSQPSQSQYFIKKDIPTDVHKTNYEGQSAPEIGPQTAGTPLKATVRNSFNVSPLEPTEFNYEPSRKNVEVNSKGGRSGSTLAPEYNGVQKTFGTSSSPYRNFNSVSYEPEKKSSAPFSRGKQSPGSEATPPPTTAYTTSRADPALNLNTVAYKTNIGFDAHSVNYAESGEDDGQYRPSADDDDGMYRPEIYDRELLSGAHSLNIAASGNRLPDDQKRSRPNHSAAPRPFVAAPAPTLPPQTAAPRTQPPYTQTSQTQPSYVQTQRPQAPFSQTQRTQPPSTQRTFDLFQTYTTTSRPSDIPPDPPSLNPITSAATGHPTTPIFATKVAGHPSNTRPATTRAPPPPPPALPAAPAHRPQPANNGPKAPHNKEDASYDYAYYDTDSGFSEYEHIEEFGKTNKNV
ncbi:hypothetical protein EVAR_94778_1 [Eumeta japonica]|uniref:Chitin-binding type-2 domain-containing protein n=1 Tax=Eumeta variegata TaxID=151549 RepID=A0A4C1UH43_EUMVA|nr:hypothetical protein EVAR_94778_1 [Eumeta japonica]